MLIRKKPQKVTCACLQIGYVQINETRTSEKIVAMELDMHLAKFFLSIRKETTDKSNKKNDRQYEPDTLSAIHSSIQRHLSSDGYAGDIKKDKEFVHSRNLILNLFLVKVKFVKK